MTCQICLEPAVTDQRNIPTWYNTGYGPNDSNLTKPVCRFLVCEHLVHVDCWQKYSRDPRRHRRDGHNLYTRCPGRGCSRQIHLPSNIQPTWFWPRFNLDRPNHLIYLLATILGGFGVVVVSTMAANKILGIPVVQRDFYNWVAKHPNPAQAIRAINTHWLFRATVTPIVSGCTAAATQLWNSEQQPNPDRYPYLVKVAVGAMLLTVTLPTVLRVLAAPKAVDFGTGHPVGDFLFPATMLGGAYASHRLFRRPPPVKAIEIETDTRAVALIATLYTVYQLAMMAIPKQLRHSFTPLVLLALAVPGYFGGRHVFNRLWKEWT